MNEELRSVRKWLLRASSRITPEYFQLPVAGREEPEYRERVYCYELYHHWRCQWPDRFPFTLAAEVDKSGHPLIPPDWKPDFVVHHPSVMTNLLVVEVKPRTADVDKMAEDLRKLTYFRRDLRDQGGNPANYDAAYFWIYGLPIAEWPRLSRRIVHRVLDDSSVDCSLITCFVHEKPECQAVEAGWTAGAIDRETDCT